jgi:hypothetical protein
MRSPSSYFLSALAAALVPLAGFSQDDSELKHAHAQIRQMREDLELQSAHISMLEKELTPEAMVRAWPAELELQGTWNASTRSRWGTSFRVFGKAISAAGCKQSGYTITNEGIRTAPPQPGSRAIIFRDISIKLDAQPDPLKCDILAEYMIVSIDLYGSHGWCASVELFRSAEDLKKRNPGDFMPYCHDEPLWRKWRT